MTHGPIENPALMGNWAGMSRAEVRAMLKQSYRFDCEAEGLEVVCGGYFPSDYCGQAHIWFRDAQGNFLEAADGYCSCNGEFDEGISTAVTTRAGMEEWLVGQAGAEPRRYPYGGECSPSREEAQAALAFVRALP